MAKEKMTTSGSLSDLIIHPGETLKEILEDRNITQKELALLTGVSPKHVSKIVSGDTNISVSYAKRLEYALGIEAQFWINYQSNYDRELFEYNEINSISQNEINILNELKEVIDDFYDNGFLEKNLKKHILVLKMRSLLGVSNLCDIPKISYATAYRMKNGINPYILYAWQKMCEIKNNNVVSTSEINVDLLKKNINAIKNTMKLDPNEMYEKLKEIFLKCGIVFDIVKNYRGAPVQGYIKRIKNNKLLLCMTLRMKYIDIFWFTLFHEIGHIVNGDTKNTFIDLEHRDDNKEILADKFAANCLIKQDKYEEFINCSDISIKSIEKLAKESNVDKSIVIGRLLRDKIIDYKDYSNQRKQYEWC